MPQLSKRKLDKETEMEIMSSLELILAKLSQKEEMRAFLLSILTATERLMLAKRLAVTFLLREGVPQDRIAEGLKVTQATVSKLQLITQARGQGFEIAYKKLIHEENIQDLKKLLLKLAKYSIKASSGRI